MKIAFLLGEFPKLSETFILNQIVGLIDRGYLVEIYATPPKETMKVHEEIEKYQLLNRTYYHPTIPKSYSQRLFKGINLILKHLATDPMLILRSLNIFRYGRSASSLRLLYLVIPFVSKKRPQYDIVQCHFGSNGIKGMLLKDINAIDGKLCTTFHGFDLSTGVKKYGQRNYERLFATGDCFLPISEFWKLRLIELGCGVDKIKVHRMGIDRGKFAISVAQVGECRDCVSNNFQIVSVARLTEKKGIEYGIRAVAKLHQIHPDLQYTIIGDGGLRPSLEQLIESLNLHHVVQLLGWKSAAEVVEVLQRSSVLLAPSVTSKGGDQEGIPVVLMEAMAMGLPVVSTWHSGIPELVEDGVSGFLVPERDPEALSEKLYSLVRSPQLCAKFGESGRLRVEEEYDVDKLNHQLVQIYQEMVS